jgi:hypothetical protein
MDRALLVGFGLAERLSASALRLSYLCGGGDAGLPAVSGAGRHLLLCRKFTGAATEYASSACGCASRGGAGNGDGNGLFISTPGGDLPDPMHSTARMQAVEQPAIEWR